MHTKKFSAKKISKKAMCTVLTGCMAAACLATGVVAYAASSNNVKYEPLIVKSGFNADVVATANGAGSDTTSREGWAYTSALDNTSSLPRSKRQSANSCLYTRSTNYKSTGYLPADGIIRSTATDGLYWQMGSYYSNNDLKLTKYGTSYGTLEFSKIGCYKKLHVLCIAGGVGVGHSATMEVTLNYSDGTSSSSNFKVQDWFSPASAATAEYQRMDTSSKGTDGSQYGAPYFTQCEMDVDTSKLIRNITISSTNETNSGMILNVFGVTGETADLASPTVKIDPTSVTQTQFDCSWTRVSGATGYRVDVSTSPTFQSFVPGYNNLDVGNVTDLNVSGLNPKTKYYVRVRAYNPFQSASSEPASTTTLDYPYYTTKVNLTLDGSAYAGKKVTLVQNGAVKHQLKEDANGEYSTSVQQVGNLMYDIYVDGAPTYKTLTLLGDVSQTVNFYTATADVSLDDNAYTDRKVTLVKDGVQTAMKEESDGIYKAVMVERAENDYKLYVDGSDALADITLADSQEKASADIYYYNAEVKLTLDGGGYTDRSVTLSQNGKTEYKLKEGNDGLYSLAVLKKPGSADNTYNVNMDGKDIGKTVSITNPTDSKTSKAYYTGKVRVKKDDLNWSETTVYATDDNGKTYLKSAGSGLYTAVFEDDGTPHDIYVKGESVNASFTDNTEQTFEYYTATFYKKQGVQHKQYILKKGSTVTKIAAPYIDGYTFDHWSTEIGGADAYDFSTPLTHKTDLYAVSAVGKVVINGTVRCDESGKTAADGKNYKMPNLSITGYPNDKELISYVQLDGANMPKYKLPTIDGITVSATSELSGTNTKGEPTDRVIIKFGSKVTVAQAESYLRNIVVTPTANQQYSMQVTVYAANYH